MIGVNSALKDTHIRKLMRIARQIGKDNDICYSRQIGTVISDDNGIILASGTNGPPRKTPHTDTKEYIEEFLWPALTPDEAYQLANLASSKLSDSSIEYLKRKSELGDGEILNPKDITSFVFSGCRNCPRKLLGYKNGERSELCSCVHSELNSIINSYYPLKGGILLCWCNVLSCINCTSQIINAGIKEVHFLEGEEYQSGALWLYEQAKIPVFRHPIGKFYEKILY